MSLANVKIAKMHSFGCECVYTCVCVQFFQISIRFIYLSFLFLPILVSAPVALNLGQSYRTLWIVSLRKALEIAGPAFIKWGQWASSRPDLFPGDINKILSKLHSSAPSHSFEDTKRVFAQGSVK